MNNENIRHCIIKVKTELISEGYLTKISCKTKEREAVLGRAQLQHGTGQGLVALGWAEMWSLAMVRSGGRPQGRLGMARKGCGCSQGPDTLTSIVTLVIPLKAYERYWQWRKGSQSVRKQQGFQKTWNPQVRCNFWKRDCLFMGFFILVKPTSCQR